MLADAATGRPSSRCPRRVAALVAGIGLLGSTPAAWSARPFVTDDARIVDHGACQVEAWTQQGPDGNEYWMLPACNPTGNLELTAGPGLLPADAGGHGAAVGLQAKTLVQPLRPGSWGVGLAIGSVLHSGVLAEDTALGTVFGYVPFSVETAGQVLTAHANLGVRYNGEPAVVSLLWGIAGELQLVRRLSAIAEVFGGNAHRDQFTQVGMRLWLVPDRLQMDGTYGGQLGVGRDQEWFTLGLRALTPPFFFLGPRP